MQIYEFIFNYYYKIINREVLGGVLGASQRVLLILPCHSNNNEKRFIIEMYLDSISV